ncbi:MAG: MTH938/NDUFAF3 family protein [Acidiferrobacterales bacterium]|nr:MTH938/NDUFAF3 family protein [Acidiferrobacterales bacterium]
MELSRSDLPGANLIKQYTSGEFLVNGVLYTQSIIVTADNVLTDWAPRTVSELDVPDFERFARFDAEIVILGTGRELVFPDLKLLQPLIDQRCGYEIMNSRAACNTFNILIGDDRKVIAALLSG